MHPYGCLKRARCRLDSLPLVSLGHPLSRDGSTLLTRSSAWNHSSVHLVIHPPALAEAFFDETTWSYKQSFMLGAVLTDGNISRDLSGFSYSAHCCDVGYIANLCAMIDGFAAGRCEWGISPP